MFYVIFGFIGANIGAMVGALMALATSLLLSNLFDFTSRQAFDVSVTIISIGGCAGFLGGTFLAFKMEK